LLQNALHLEGAGHVGRRDGGTDALSANAAATDAPLDPMREAAERSLAETPEAKGPPDPSAPSAASLGKALKAKAQQEASSSRPAAQ